MYLRAMLATAGNTTGSTFFITEKPSVNHPSIHGKEPLAGGRVCRKLVDVIEGRVKSGAEES